MAFVEFICTQYEFDLSFELIENEVIVPSDADGPGTPELD
jgi:hypothetical protein